jgi:ABC-type lipoprotein export system ATPase subunit
MTEKHTKAQFWKCALQVNPSGYIAYRGTSHGMTEDEYNLELLRIAKENGIKVIGLADHGNVDGVEAIRSLMNQHDILVFPGFEIASTEKVHFVCLFPENTSKDQLNRYLGALGLTDPADGIWPSNLGGNDLLTKIEELGGFAYAAHCTDDNGVLKGKFNHVWQNPLLKAVQISGIVDDLKNDEGNGYLQILRNKMQDYKREFPVAIINAKDVATPQDLANLKASCLIKMTNPGFESFKLAFQDPESRVRLNSDVSDKYYSRIESLKITGGYLDGVQINFSEHLNAVIGGRGTGKSTLIECIRYALQLKPIGKDAQKKHDEIVKENLGNPSKGRIELVIRSSRMNGKRFTVARRYGESASVKDENGTPSTFEPIDLLPDIEILGQNEIYEIAQDKNKNSLRRLLIRFLETGQQDAEARIQESLVKLAENRKKLIEAQASVASIEDEVALLPKLEEQVGQFKVLGLEDKLKIIPLLETEKRLQNRVISEECINLDNAFKTVYESLPDTVFLSDSAIGHLPHVENLRKMRVALDDLRKDAEFTLSQWQQKYAVAQTAITAISQDLDAGIQQGELVLEKTFKEFPASEGKTGKEIGTEFQRLLKEIERIRPKKTMIDNRMKVVTELLRQRKGILDDLSSIRADRSAQFERSLKSLNRRLSGKLKLTVKPEADRAPVIQFLLGCKLESVGEGRLSWVKEANDFSPVKLAEIVRQGADELRSAGWGITPTVADALPRLSTEQILQLEEIELPDLISIELNTAHEGQETFRPLEKLSTGQQCTAILHLLLLQNLDPLIMDQPEDNLDNAFIADRIVTELRSAKIARQFIFATHNANIPVFGDAEWIGVFEVKDGQPEMPSESQGAIDVIQVRDKAANILEGGKAAFNQRKAKYGY